MNHKQASKIDKDWFAYPEIFELTGGSQLNIQFCLLFLPNNINQMVLMREYQGSKEESVFLWLFDFTYIVVWMTSWCIKDNGRRKYVI